MGTVIAAVRTDEEFLKALKSQVSTVFMLAPNIENIEMQAAKAQDMLAVQRFFVLDSQSVDTVAESAKTSKADMIELMPGTVAKVIKRIKAVLDTPIVAGGLIEAKEEVTRAYASGAVAVSTGRKELWN